MDEIMRIKDNTRDIKNRMRLAAKLATQKAAHRTMAYANANEVPYDTGRLINSGMYELWEMGDIVSYKMSYGGSEGLAGGSQFASRLYENINWELKNGKMIVGKGELNQGIYTSPTKMGQLTYAKKWHQSTPAGGFQRNRKFHYLSDPIEGQFPAFLMEETTKAFANIGLTVSTSGSIMDSYFIPDEVSL
jgi:hypothetical protein